ncbi:MAG: DUF6077 domain-containing protein [Culicoidibacterales bacterium]
MYLYVCLSLFLVFCFLLGKIVVAEVNLQEAKHPLIYGVMAYFLVFFALSALLVILHVPWKVFYLAQMILHVLLVIIITYFLIKRKISNNISWNSLSNNIAKNWGVYLVLLCFSLLYLSSKNSLFFSIEETRYNLAIVDDYAYIARAMSAIDSQAIFTLETSVISGQQGPADILLLISYWELFWAFGSEILNIDLLAFTHTFVALFVYIFAFFSIDEFLYLICGENNRVKSQLLMPLFLLLYLFLPYDSEFAKFLFFPWYGNVVTFIVFFPTFSVIFYQLLHNDRARILYVFYPLLMVGFSPVSIMFLSVIYLCSGIFIMVYYRKKSRKSLAGYSIIISAIFCFFVIYSGIKLLEITRLLDLFKGPNLYSEYSAVYGILSPKLSIILLGLFLLYLSKIKKNNAKEENFVIILMLIIVGSAILRPISTFLFNIFSFPFRRFIESLTLYMYIYALYKILLEIKFSVKQTCLLLMVYVLSMVPQSGVFLVKNRKFYALKNIINLERVTDISKEVSSFLDNLGSTDKNVCIYGDRAINTKYGNVDLGSSVLASKGAKLISCGKNISSNYEIIDYIIMQSISDEQYNIPEKFKFTKIEVIETEEASLTIYGKER